MNKIEITLILFMLSATFIMITKLYINSMKIQYRKSKINSCESNSYGSTSTSTIYVIRIPQSCIEYIYNNIPFETLRKFSLTVAKNKISNEFDSCLFTYNKELAYDLYDRLHLCGYTVDIYEDIPNFYIF